MDRGSDVAERGGSASPVDAGPNEFAELFARSRLVALRDDARGHLRTVPPTPRSRAVAERILESAAETLRTTPVHRLTTHRVADAAGVNIATLYRFYRDVNAILGELAMRREIAQCERMVVAMPAFVTAPDWRPFVAGLMDAMAVMRTQVPEGPGVVTALLTIPELRPIVEAGREAGVEMTALALTRRDPSRSYAAWLPITRVAIAAARQGLDDAHSADGPVDRERIELTKQLVIAFLERFLPA